MIWISIGVGSKLRADSHLDHADVDVLLQQVGGKAVPQGVQRHALVDLGHLRRRMAGAVELARGHRLHAIAARKQPTLWPCCPPPAAQQCEQACREHDVTVLAALALLHPDDHPPAVDVGDLERDQLGGAQACAVGHAQRCLVLEPGAALSSRATSSGLSTTGSLRGSWMNVVCSTIAWRLSVT